MVKGSGDRGGPETNKTWWSKSCNINFESEKEISLLEIYPIYPIQIRDFILVIIVYILPRMTLWITADCMKFT